LSEYVWELSPLLPAAIRFGIGRHKGRQKLRGHFSAAGEKTLVHDASMSFWANVSGLNVEAYSLEPVLLR
jgi:hypothetical protein